MAFGPCVGILFLILSRNQSSGIGLETVKLQILFSQKMTDEIQTQCKELSPAGESQVPLYFFLGGIDLEMVAIRDLLQMHGFSVVDGNLGWGAKLSAYKSELEELARSGDGVHPVLVELEIDAPALLSPFNPGGYTIVDHHGDRAGHDTPTALEQIRDLIGLPSEEWTRFHELVAANDRGHILGLVEVGANQAEIEEIRLRERELQGISTAEDTTAAHAIENRVETHGGAVTRIDLPHAKTAAVTDRMSPALGGPGYDNLVIFSPEEVNFFGNGSVIERLDSRFPGGWKGGNLPKKGFWGLSGAIDTGKVLSEIEEETS